MAATPLASLPFSVRATPRPMLGVSADSPACQQQNKVDASNATIAPGSGEPVKPPRWAPAYIHACHSQSWKLHLRNPVGEWSVHPYRCRSRRHAGPCRDAWRHQLYCRTRDGELGFAQTRDCVFLTFTLTAAWHRRRTLASREDATQLVTGELGRWFDAVRMHVLRGDEEWSALERLARRRGTPKLERAALREAMRARAALIRPRYQWVVEEHKSGVVHAHAVVVCPAMADELRADRQRHGMDPTAKGAMAPAWRQLAQRGGLFGRLDASVARDKGSLASYVAKVAGRRDDARSERMAGELAKAQAGERPEAFARNQRTFGTTRGFLAPRRRAVGWTGYIVDSAGRILSGPLARQQRSDAAMLRIAAAACEQAPQAGRNIAASIADSLGLRPSNARAYVLKRVDFLSEHDSPSCSHGVRIEAASIDVHRTCGLNPCTVHRIHR